MAKKPSTAASPKTAAVAPVAQAQGDHGHAAPAMSGGAAVVDEMDYPAHEAMYHRFTGMVKWGIVGAFVLIVFLFIVIHPLIAAPAS